MKIKGIVDNVNTCDCCGKTGLAKTVALETNDGEIVYYGTTCASIALGYGKEYTSRNVHKLVQREEDKQKRAIERARAMESAQEHAARYNEPYLVLWKSNGRRGSYSTMSLEQYMALNNPIYGREIARLFPQ
jgi:hypothetical protein